ncbi:adhesion G-protein coupled receptor G7-like [Hoplias malabaricus]|uniref:adhesion G-protein coupled receptor G7-like n=1 Tax=Hoplias malabaricus TaxID=27720 RepID=UPI003462994A
MTTTASTTTTVPTTTTTTTVLTTTTTTTLLTTTTTITTSSSIFINNTTTPALLCMHGGQTQNGYCICTAEYSGKSCETPNFCDPDTRDSFSFPKTIIGQFTYSNTTCGPKSINAGVPVATALCMNNTKFGLIQSLDCNLTFDIILLNLSSPQNQQNLAFSTQILTSVPDKLSPQNISRAAQIASTLLSSSEVTQNITLAAVTTISQLLNIGVNKFTEDTVNSTNWLTDTLQNYSVSSNSNGSQLIQPNVAVLSMNVTKSLTHVQLNAFKSLSSTFLPKNINVNSSASGFPSDQFPIDVQMSVQLKPPNTAAPGINVGFVLYNNDLFFKSHVFQDTLGSTRKVISGKINQTDALENITFSMSNQNFSSLSLQDFACVFWNYTLNDWSTKGCSKILVPADNSDAPLLTCSCGHATNFAVLVSFGPNYNYSPPLGVISIIGCALSVAGLVTTILFQILTRKSRGVSPTLLMVSICVCMTIYYLLFIFGINNPVQQNYVPSENNSIPKSDFYNAPDKGPCTAMAALLQYFLLASFTWSSLYAAHIFFLLKNAISGPPKNFNTICTVVGWGFPAVIVGITLGVTYRPNAPLNYRQEEFCWLAGMDINNNFNLSKPIFWGFLLPLAVMIFFNIFVLLYFANTTCKADPSLSSSQVTPLRKKLLSSMSLAVVLGLSWVIAYFMFLPFDLIAHNILMYAFCICNTTQGIQIFILFTLRTRFFKEKFLIFMKTVPAPEMALHRMSYELWQVREKEVPESYRSTDFDNNK